MKSTSETNLHIQYSYELVESAAPVSRVISSIINHMASLYSMKKYKVFENC